MLTPKRFKLIFFTNELWETTSEKVEQEGMSGNLKKNMIINPAREMNVQVGDLCGIRVFDTHGSAFVVIVKVVIITVSLKRYI